LLRDGAGVGGDLAECLQCLSNTGEIDAPLFLGGEFLLLEFQLRGLELLIPHPQDGLGNVKELGLGLLGALIALERLEKLRDGESTWIDWRHG
jgi:hypothetical protein